MKIRLCLKCPVWCLPSEMIFFGRTVPLQKGFPIFKATSSWGKLAENLPRIIVCICTYLDPSCFDCGTSFERWHPKMAGCFHINNIFEGPKVLGEEIPKKYECQASTPHLSMLPSTNMSLCCMSNIHLLFQLSSMLIWDKVNNHCKGSNASQTHVLEKHHHCVSTS